MNDGRSMRVLQLSKFYPPHLGGIETVARDLSAGLLARGAQVEVLCANKKPQRSHEIDPAGVPVTRAASYGVLLSTSMAPGLPRLLRQRQGEFDIVHVHMPDPLAAVAIWWARPHARVVLHWHSDVVRQRRSMALYAPLQNWLLSRADAVVASSAAYADSSEPLRPWRRKVQVIPIGTAAPQAASSAQVADTKARYGGRRIVFCLGRMTHYKGFEVLIEACRHLPPDVVVVVAGGGDDWSPWRQRARAAGLGNQVLFVGPMTAAQVESHFSASELFCLASTSRAEAYGVAVVEAMARGLPVVATKIPGSGLSWLHQDGVTGLAVPPGDPVALAQAMNRLLADGVLRRRCAAAARDRWLQHLQSDAMCDAMQALYRRLLG